MELTGITKSFFWSKQYMRLLNLLALVLFVGAVVVAPLAAQPEVPKVTPAQVSFQKDKYPPPPNPVFSGSGVAAGIGMGLTIIGAGIGLGRIGSSALESMARQPEVAPRIQTAMIIIAAMLEGSTLDIGYLYYLIVV